METPELRNRTREGDWSLFFDTTRPDHTDTDGIKNPRWMVVADRYNVVGGDLARAGWTFVAIHTVEANGDHIGRDGQGRAVRLVPLPTLHACAPSTVTGACGVCGAR